MIPMVLFARNGIRHHHHDRDSCPLILAFEPPIHSIPYKMASLSMTSVERDKGWSRRIARRMTCREEASHGEDKT